MPKVRIYNLFISHSWSYDEDYIRLAKMLNSDVYFYWKNYSVSWDNPLTGGSRKRLAEEISNQIRLASVVLVISGIYVAHKEWIQFEIDLADAYDKPIIGIRPRGSINIPSAITRSAVEIVNWNTNSVVESIRRNAL
jgi:hypothetical protein